MDFLIKFFDKVSFAGIIVSFTAYFLGIRFPDWDFKFNLKHRSILTHSPLILLMLIRFYERDSNDTFRYFLIGFALALSLHFIFDLYPKGWGGGALLKIPVVGISCNPQLTKILLIFFTVLSTIIAVAYTKNSMEFLYLFSLGVFTILKNMKKEGKLIRPLFSYSFFLLVIGCIKYKDIFKFLESSIGSILKRISMFF